MATIRVYVEASRVIMRVWLKAVVDGETEPRVLRNVYRRSAARERNQLLEELSASGEWDQVIGETMYHTFAPAKPSTYR